MNELTNADRLLKEMYLNIVKESLYDIPVERVSKEQRGYIVQVRTTPKIGRNEKCPCGSNKKYKYCCGGKDETPV